MDRSKSREPTVALRNIGYQPLESQVTFHESTARFKGFSGPIGSGKSQALVHEAIRLSYLNQNRCGLIGAPTYQMLRDATQRALFEALEETRIPFVFNKAENALVLTDVRSKVLFRSLDEYEHLRGTNLAWFGVDELTYTQEAAWLRLEGRLRDPRATRLCGFAAWTPKGFDWVYKRFIRDESGSYQVILAKPFENKHLLAAVPDFYDRLRKTYDQQFFEQEALGQYLNQSAGRVYRNFSRAIHLRPREIDGGSPLLWALDFNVDPLCSVVAQIHDGVAQVLDEIVLRNSTTEEACEAFFGRFEKYAGTVRIYGDATGNNSHTTGSTDYQIINEFFRRRLRKQPHQRVPASNPSVRDRISLVNAMLQNADGETTLYLDPKCRGLAADFEELSYKEGSTVPDKDRDPLRSHLSDALGYLLWQEFNFGPIKTEKGRIF
jgi:hypothetical protein